jgi:pimeloyl-ACP methyl ester carboxylesterase
MAEDYVYGNGPVRAMLLHNWFGDAHDFDAMFAAVDPDVFSFACPEFRGYGSRKDEPGPFDVATIAADTIAMADRLGWERFSVVGHSMGAKVAFKLAVDAPGRVERLCGIAPVWAGRSPFDESKLAIFRAAGAALGPRQGILTNTSGGRLPPIWAKRAAEHSMHISSQEAFSAYFESWALDDFSAGATSVTAQTLIIVGAHDGGVSPEVAKATWIAKLANAELVVLPDASHYPPNECPLILAAHVARFLAAG